LSIEDLLEWAQGHRNGIALNALPLTRNEIVKLPREYIGNVIYTVTGQPFQDWVDAKVKERNARVMNDRDLSILMDPDIAAIY